MTSNKEIVTIRRIEDRILLIRGEKVILDADLAGFYGVQTKRLNEQVKRNRGRFPPDFVFQLNKDEKNEVVAKCDHLEKLKFSRTMPYAFTEHGALMAANVINTNEAIEMSVFIIRAFVKIRQLIASHVELSKKISQLEKHLTGHDEQIQILFRMIKQLLKSDLPSKRRRIGFKLDTTP